MNTGPMSDEACITCGRHLRDSWWSPAVVALGVLLGGLVAIRISSIEFGSVPIVAGAVAALLFQAYVVPLVGRDDA